MSMGVGMEDGSGFTIPSWITTFWAYGPVPSARIIIKKYVASSYYAPGFRSMLDLFKGKYGAEIGGPSDMFSKNSHLPVYPVARKIDMIDFVETDRMDMLELAKRKKQGTFSSPSLRAGTRLIAEGTDLKGIGANRYDFILSSHVVEHLANPIKALNEWKRILKPGGYMVVVAPHLKGGRDHNRQLTPFSHMLKDYREHTKESDTTHMQEIIEKTDPTFDKYAADHEKFVERVRGNYETRVIHQHTYIPETVIRLLDYVGFGVVYVDMLEAGYIVVVAQKVGTSATAHRQNLRYLDKGASWRKNMIFDIDKA